MEANTSSIFSVHKKLLSEDAYDFIVNDDGAMLNLLPGIAAQEKNFDLGFYKVFWDRDQHHSNRSKRLDVM